MGQLGINIPVKLLRTEVLDKLRTNLERHKKVVKEARVGYLKVAKTKVVEELERLEKELEKVPLGTHRCPSIHVSVQPPHDNSEAYRTVIAMLEMHQDDHVMLSPTEFRQLILDEWDWSSRFWASNSAYSATAATYTSTKNDDDDDEPVIGAASSAE